MIIEVFSHNTVLPLFYFSYGLPVLKNSVNPMNLGDISERIDVKCYGIIHYLSLSDPDWALYTQYGLHFLHIFKRSLQIFSLQQFKKYNLYLRQMWQSIIFILQQARYLGSSHLHSSMQVGTNLHLFLHAKTTIFKSSRKPAGSPLIPMFM